MNDVWNKFEMLLCINYIAYFAMSFSLFFTTEAPQLVVIKLLEVTLIMFSFFKLVFYLRVFDQMSFLVQMMQSVFFDLRFFFFLFFILIAFFSLMLKVLLPEAEEKAYLGTGIFAHFFIAMRSSIGDNEMDDYKDAVGDQTMIWVVWLVIIIVGNVVFMNFIIAVVNESYENCMMKSVAQSYKTKVDMIIEREEIMSAAELSNPDFFPRFILVRRPKDLASRKEEWQGFVKEIKSNQERVLLKVQEDIQLLKSEMQVHVSDELQAIEEQNKIHHQELMARVTQQQAAID